jgi:hypothetical protein
VLTFDDAGQLHAYLVEAGANIVKLPELLGHTPKRLTDFVSLGNASYLLGTEPQVALMELRGSSVRLLQNEDPRAHLRSARLRLVRDAKGARIAYLLSSVRLRSADVSWYVYPIDTATGNVEEPLRIPLGGELRVCEQDEDGWLIEREIDELADLELGAANSEWSGRGQVLLLGSEQGLCVRKLLVVGQQPSAKIAVARTPTTSSQLSALYLDREGQGRPLDCQLTQIGK